MMRLINKDTIYRQGAVEALKNAEPLVRDFGYYKVIETIRLLPSAEPDKDLIHLQKEQAYMQGYEDGRKSRRGKWELHTDERFDIDYYKCSECGYEPYRKMDISNFCPNCGSYNGGEEE